MASDDTLPQSQPASSGPGTHPSASSYLPDLPLAEDLQALLGGGYLVENFLGQGGMGAVYKGLQMPLRRPVAIKILQKRQAAGGEDEFAFEERFKREAYAMAALTHPHIVQVYDCGDAGENYLFISMELVEGGDLSDAIKAGQVTPEAALKLIPQICDGLQAAHDRGIVHRDIKPANIFLTKDGRAKVADFGLAKKFDVKNTLVTKAGLGMGTPDYAAPEQYEGVDDIDHRADIYAFGVMMYQMLTGRLPRGATFKMPSQLSGVDPRIDSIVQKAMESERDDRYQSTAEIKAALAQVGADGKGAPLPVTLTSAVPAIERPVTGPRPVTEARPITEARPATVGRPITGPRATQPVRRPASGVVVAIPVAETETKKKSNVALIGVIAAVVVIGLGAMFLLRKPAATTSDTSTPSATAASTPSPASTSTQKASPTTTQSLPAQWRSAFTNLDDFRGGRSGQAEAKDGWVTPGSLFGMSIIPPNQPGPVKNAGMRARVRYQNPGIPGDVRFQFEMRIGTGHYYLGVTPTGKMKIGVYEKGAASQDLPSLVSDRAPLNVGEEHVLEFFVIGTRLVARCDGQLLGTLTDSRFISGEGKLRSSVPFRDVEFINLDGLREADALEIAGVDAQGKDTGKTSVASSSPSSSPAPQTTGSIQGSPAMKPTAGTANPPGSFPPGQWVKPLGKFEDLPQVHRDGGLVKWEDGWLKPTDASKGFGFSITGFKGANMAIRIVMRNPGVNPSGGPVLQTRITGNDGRYEMMPSGGSLAISHLKEPTRTVLANGSRRLFISPDRDISIEMAVIGTQLYGRGEDGLAVLATNSRLLNGGIGIHSRSWIRDIEVMNLDGVPEAEALRLIGVDEKGNDLRLPENEKFAPGQWTKVFTQFDQLPPDVRLPTSGVTWDDGWIRYEKPTRLYLPSSLVGNYGVRARFQRVNGKNGATLTLRNQSLTAVEQYRLFNSGGSRFACETYNGKEAVPIFVAAPPTPVKDDTAYTMEFGVVGNRLVGRLNDSLVKMASDDRFNTGHAYFTGSESTRDIEVINLNGLPEAEALRLLGVDESGNDLRPQERQRIAQARMNEAIASIPEVKPLHDQFIALLSERVTGPFEADLAKLNTGYLGGLDRALSEAKAAGRTSDVEALEAEKKLITDRQPLPLQDDEKTPESLKKLRGIYRPSRAQLDAQREGSLKTLTGPLNTRLAALATDFTGKGREADAKVVQEFMASLSAGVPVAASSPIPATESGTAKTASAGPVAPSASEVPARNFTPVDPRSAAEWVFSLGGTIDIEERGERRTIRGLDELPKGRIEILKVWLDKGKAIGTPTATFTTLEPLAGLKKLTHLETHFYDVTDADTDVLASFPALVNCQINDSKKFTGARLGLLRSLDALDMVHLGASKITRAGLEAFATLKRVTRMDLSNTPLTDEDLAALAEMKSLRMLSIRSTLFTAAGLAHLKKLDAVTDVGWRFRPGTAEGDGKVISQLFPRLTAMTMDLSRDVPGSEIAGALSHFPNLDKVIFSNGSVVTDEQGRALAGVQTLKSIHFTSGSAITDATFEELASHKNLKSLRVDGAPELTRAGLMALVRLKSLSRVELRDNKQLDEAAFAEFKKQRPDVTLVK